VAGYPQRGCGLASGGGDVSPGNSRGSQAAVNGRVRPPRKDHPGSDPGIHERVCREGKTRRKITLRSIKLSPCGFSFDCTDD